MPIYEYECTECSLRFELRRSLGDNSGATCPSCKRKARRVFSATSVISGLHSSPPSYESKVKKVRFKDLTG